MIYLQLTHRLRWSNGPSLGDTVSERPRHERTREFLDGPDGTIVDIPDGAPVDVAFLLKIGAIVEIPQPQKGAPSGQNRR